MAANAWQRGSWVFDFLFSETKDPAAPETTSPESTEMTQEQLLDSFHLMATSSEDLPILWNAINNYESMKALEATDIKKWKVRPRGRWTLSLGPAGRCWSGSEPWIETRFFPKTSLSLALLSI